MKQKVINDMSKRGMNQAEWAELMGLAQCTVSLLVSGKRNPSKRVLMLMELPNKTLVNIRVK